VYDPAQRRPWRGIIDSSTFVFAVDLLDGGLGSVLDEIRDRAGIGGVAMAAAYHHARDILPHNPKRKVYFHEGGTVFFRPQLDRYGAISPRPSSLVYERDVLAELCDAAAAREMKKTAWTVYLHNSRLSAAHPEHAPCNAFGDRSLTDLCPADPAVRSYVLALTGDICRYPVDTIMAEALHFKTIEHGYHHERYFLDLGATGRFLLGLCFCEWCMAAALERGVDGEGVRRNVQMFLLDVFERGSGGHEPLDLDLIGAVAGGEMAGYVESRAHSVSTLVAAAADVARDSGVGFTFSAHGGSAKGGGTKSSDRPGDAWVLGVDLPEVASRVDGFEVLGYVGDTAELQPLISGYLAAIGATPASVALRPMFPDTRDPDELIERVRIVQRLGVERVDFYHYGLMPSSSLDWIRAALSP
jgi:hypothetical protein